MKHKHIYLLISVILAAPIFLFSHTWIAKFLMVVQAVFLIGYLFEANKEQAKLRQSKTNDLSNMTPEQRKRFVEENFR